MSAISDFSGEQARNYARFRRGYPRSVVHALLATFGLDRRSVVLDLGCGTGQLTAPLAPAVGSVIGVDPQPDMLRLARDDGIARGITNISWVLGSDTDIPTLGRLLGESSVDAVTIGNAVHWMRPERLFADLAPLIRPGGGIAVIANGSPLWLHDVGWARALRAHNESWFGPVTSGCGTSERERQSYRDALAAAGFDDITRTVISYDDELTLDYVIGHLYSAMPDSQLSASARLDYTGGLRDALLETEPGGLFTEHVDVDMLMGRRT